MASRNPPDDGSGSDGPRTASPEGTRSDEDARRALARKVRNLGTRLEELGRREAMHAHEEQETLRLLETVAGLLANTRR